MVIDLRDIQLGSFGDLQGYGGIFSAPFITTATKQFVRIIMAVGGASLHSSRNLDGHRPRSAGDGTRHGKRGGGYMQPYVVLLAIYFLVPFFLPISCDLSGLLAGLCSVPGAGINYLVFRLSTAVMMYAQQQLYVRHDQLRCLISINVVVCNAV